MERVVLLAPPTSQTATRTTFLFLLQSFLCCLYSIKMDKSISNITYILQMMEARTFFLIFILTGSNHIMLKVYDTTNLKTLGSMSHGCIISLHQLYMHMDFIFIYYFSDGNIIPLTRNRPHMVIDQCYYTILHPEPALAGIFFPYFGSFIILIPEMTTQKFYFQFWPF
jgi:hypothetical protein